jgi:CS domain
VHKYDTDLFQPINPKESSFKILSTKLEIQLVKANGISWAAIEPKPDIKSWVNQI